MTQDKISISVPVEYYTEVKQQNAKLEATNADLLEALEDALAVLQRMSDDDIEVNYGLLRLILEAKDKAIEAIRKAKS